MWHIATGPIIKQLLAWSLVTRTQGRIYKCHSLMASCHTLLMFKVCQSNLYPNPRHSIQSDNCKCQCTQRLSMYYDTNWSLKCNNMLTHSTQGLSMIIRDNSHNRHNRRWCTFFKPAYLFPQRTRNGLLLGKFIQRKITQICTSFVIKILDAPS